MNVLFPRFRLNLLPAMLGYGLLGALIAGLYGVIHDQVTYSLCPEYFTRLKFVQFHYADFGLPPRFFVAEIGFLATWWVGFVAGWFLSRMAVPIWPPVEARSFILRGIGIILVSAFAASLLGWGLGLLRRPNADYSAWQEFVTAHGVVDLPGFVRVAYIHNASYLGGLIGLILALVHLRRSKQTRSNGW
jgi:hypothetical protein